MGGSGVNVSQIKAMDEKTQSWGFRGGNEWKDQHWNLGWMPSKDSGNV